MTLSSCSSRKIIGTYYNSIELKNKEKSEKLILKKNHFFEYILGKTDLIGNKNDGYFAKIYQVKGQGKYHIKNDTIFLNFKRNFDYKNYEKENLIINTYESNNEKVKLKIDFGSRQDVKISVFSNKEKIYNGISDFYGNIEFQINKENFPLKIKFDLANSTNHMFGDYDLELVEINDYIIRFRLPNLIPVEKDLSFPITRDKNGIEIGKMKNVL